MLDFDWSWKIITIKIYTFYTHILSFIKLLLNLKKRNFIKIQVLNIFFAGEYEVSFIDAVGLSWNDSQKILFCVVVVVNLESSSFGLFLSPLLVYFLFIFCLIKISVISDKNLIRHT